MEVPRSYDNFVCVSDKEEVKACAEVEHTVTIEMMFKRFGVQRTI